MSKEQKTKNLLPEWSHKIDIATIEDKPFSVAFEATAEERKDLARRLDVKEVKAVKADLILIREKGGNVIYVSGSFKAEIIQTCVVTLKPLERCIKEPLEAWYSDYEQAASLARQRRERESATGNSEFPLLEEYEDPEPVAEGQIDLGELVTQYLSLAIDPFPHAEGAVLEKTSSTGKAGEDTGRPNPFAALKDWKAQREEKGEKEGQRKENDKK